ncbi:hypothetical protein NGRA_2825 [Nosema granulosis]|uniref:Uncharacterized protein n=1 Tax=Nosema granulosis TaxID=83296 RepID=A0A9P6GWD0_9MICR|nr:hypothetical protein NGRA_2825 [Nosema granulosis]
MLTFTRGKEILQTIEIHNKDPLSLSTYQEILQKEKKPVFSLLICATTRFVYLARDIIEMRYSVDEQINVYLLRDPLSREVVEDVWFFEVLKNPIYESKIVYDSKMAIELCTTTHRNVLEDTTVYAHYISNEIGVLYDKDLQYRILKYKRDEIDIISLIVYILVVIFALFLLLVTFSFTIESHKR